VLRRCPALPAVVTAALILAAQPSPVRAAGIIPNTTNSSASYQLKNNNPSDAPPVTKIVASVIPPGNIIPPDPQTSPLIILPGSSGFDQNNLKVLLGAGTNPTGEPLQALALDFGEGGFHSGGTLNFSVNLDKAFLGAPSLVLPPESTGLAIAQLSSVPPVTPGSGGPGTPEPTGPPGGSQVPEPLTLLLWSTGVAGFGFVRARATRSGQRRTT
jgi:hypothetical protein